MGRSETIEVYEHDAPTLDAIVRQEQPDGTFAAVGLTGATVTFEIKQDLDEGDQIALYSTTAGSIAVVDAAAGRVQILVTTAATATPGRYRYRMIVTKSSRPVTVREGTWRVLNT